LGAFRILWRCQQLIQQRILSCKLIQQRILAGSFFQQRLFIWLHACFQQQQWICIRLRARFQQQQRLFIWLHARFQQQRLLAGGFFQQRLLAC